MSGQEPTRRQLVAQAQQKGEKKSAAARMRGAVSGIAAARTVMQFGADPDAPPPAPAPMPELASSDSDSDSDGGAPAPPRRPARRRLLPQTPVGGPTATGGQFKMMRVPTAIKPQTPPKTPIGRPRIATRAVGRVAQLAASRQDTPDSIASSSLDSQAYIIDEDGKKHDRFAAVPIAPAGNREHKPGAPTAQHHQLADYTKRKVAEIMAREEQSLAHLSDERRPGSRMSTLSTGMSSVGSLDIDEIRAVRGFGEDKKLGEGEALSESDDEEPEEDADQLLMMELQNVQLTPDAWILLYGGIMSLVAIFVIVFFFLIKTTIQRECDNPWFSDTEHFTFPAAPRCGWLKRCGNIGGLTCNSQPVDCWLEDIYVDHFRGNVLIQILPEPAPGEIQTNITAYITHYSATRKGLDGLQSRVESEDKSIAIFAADNNTAIVRDTQIDQMINCRRADIVINLPGDLGTNRCDGRHGDCGARAPRTLEEFPAIKVATAYGEILLPRSDDFYFKDVELETVHSDLAYDDIRAGSVKLIGTGNGLGPEKPALSDCCDWQHLRLNSPTAHFVGMESVDGSIYASAVSLPNTTTEDPLTGAYVASSFGIFNATTQTGSIEMGLLTTGIVIISSTGDEGCAEACPEEGDIQLTVYNEFAGSFDLSCPGCELSIEGEPGVTMNKELHPNGCHWPVDEDADPPRTPCYSRPQGSADRHRGKADAGAFTGSIGASFAVIRQPTDIPGEVVVVLPSITVRSNEGNVHLKVLMGRADGR